MMPGDIAKLILGALRMSGDGNGLGNEMLPVLPARLDGDGGNGGVRGPAILLVLVELLLVLRGFLQGVGDDALVGNSIVLKVEGV